MADLQLVRTSLLEVHRQLLQAERVIFESRHGRVTANQFFLALTNDPLFSWLAPLNAAIVRFDELLDLQTKSGQSSQELAEHLAVLRDLLELKPRDDDFGKRYTELVHNSPEIAFAHAALAHTLATTVAPKARPSSP
jgi:hypothetical protein